MAKTWKQPKYSLRDDWIKKTWYLYTREYYSAMRRDEILPFLVTWTDPDSIMLSDISQREKVKNNMISPVCGT